MLGAQLAFHFLNAIVLTVVIAPLFLWRYRRAVLAGVQDRGGAPLPLAPVVPRHADSVPSSSAGADGALAWEARMRRRIFAATLAALAPPSLLMAGAGRIILVVDTSTDRALLERVVPGPSARMQLIGVERGNVTQTDSAFVALLRAAA